MSNSLSGKYLCSPSRELHAVHTRAHIWECSLHERCMKHVWNVWNGNLLDHKAHDVIGGVPRSIKGRLLNTSSSLLSSGAVCCEQCVTISKAHSVLEGSECVHCELFSMRMLRSCLSLLSGEKGQASTPHRSDPTAVNIKLSGRKKCGRKRYTTNRENHPFTMTFWSMLPPADQLFKDADFIFQQDLSPVHTAKSTKSRFNEHGVGVLDWPANSPDLNIENLWVLSRGKWETRDQKMQMRWRPLSKKPGLHTTSAVPQTDHLHATPNWDSN